MLPRTKNKHDMNHDKYIGVGGHLEQGESPEECILREVREETGYTLTRFRLRGVITFVIDDLDEYTFLYTADGFEGQPIPCTEGPPMDRKREDRQPSPVGGGQAFLPAAGGAAGRILVEIDLHPRRADSRRRGRAGNFIGKIKTPARERISFAPVLLFTTAAGRGRPCDRRTPPDCWRGRRCVPDC